MIAFTAKPGRGRRQGSKNLDSFARRHCKGSATSAAAVNGVRGVRVQYHRLWVPGEGWVRWAELAAQVKAAHEAWVARCHAKGRKIFDGWDARYAQIEEAVARKGSGEAS